MPLGLVVRYRLVLPYHSNVIMIELDICRLSIWLIYSVNGGSDERNPVPRNSNAVDAQSRVLYKLLDSHV